VVNRYNDDMPILVAFFTFSDLLIIVLVATLLFGRRLPSLMRSLGNGVEGLRCPHCGWWSWHATHCLHCGKLKLDPLETTFGTPAQGATMGHGQTQVHVPKWLVVVVLLSGVAWVADAIWGKWTSHDLHWSVWLHWTTLTLVSTSIMALTVIAIKSYLHDRH
jgi:hypothetical protein